MGDGVIIDRSPSRNFEGPDPGALEELPAVTDSGNACMGGTGGGEPEEIEVPARNRHRQENLDQDGGGTEDEAEEEEEDEPLARARRLLAMLR